MYLNHLSMSGFRGIGSSLDLPLGHRTIIYGPNGSGKTSILQAIAWALYGKLPTLTGGVFTREDALVNDFWDWPRAEITLTLSDGVVITRTRNKQSSTTKGTNPLSVSFPADDPQAAVEQLIGLNSEEFLAAVFLNQEAIRDFITTTPEARSATIDRMIGTYLLRTLIKTVDPNVPAEAIEKAAAAIEQLERQLSQASVLSREVIQKRKEEYGDPSTLPQLLEDIRQDLAPITEKVGRSVPEAALADLDNGLTITRQAQLDRVSVLENRAGLLAALKDRYVQAAITNWQTIRQRKDQYGDPSALPNLLQEIQENLTPIAHALSFSTPQTTIADLERGITETRRAQPNVISKLEQEAGQLGTLKVQYEQAAVTNWQTVHQRRSQYGDPATLPGLLREIRQELSSIVAKLGIPVPPATVADLGKSLAEARRLQPSAISKLEQRAGLLSTLKERYEQASKEVIPDLSIPTQLKTRQSKLQEQINNLNREIPALNRQLNDRQATERRLAELRSEIQDLPALRVAIEQMQRDLETVEAAGKRGRLYNQILDVGREYLEQARPEHCPLCKETIKNLDRLLDTLHHETPADIEKMRQEYNNLRSLLAQRQNQALQLEHKQKQAEITEADLAKFPSSLESQMEEKQRESERVANELAAVQADIAQIEGRIKSNAENRNRLQAILNDVENSLGQPVGKDVSASLDLATLAARAQAAELQAFDFQPIADKLDRAKQLDAIQKDEIQLRQQLDTVLQGLKRVLRQLPGDDVAGAIDKAIQTTRKRADEIRVFDFQPIADRLDRARQLDAILKDEVQLRKQLDIVLEEVRRELGQPPGEDIAATLDKAIHVARKEAAEIRALNFQPIADALNRARQLDQIQKDESRLREFESNYQTASREKA